MLLRLMERRLRSLRPPPTLISGTGCCIGTGSWAVGKAAGIPAASSTTQCPKSGFLDRRGALGGGESSRDPSCFLHHSAPRADPKSRLSASARGGGRWGKQPGSQLLPPPPSARNQAIWIDAGRWVVKKAAAFSTTPHPVLIPLALKGAGDEG